MNRSPLTRTSAVPIVIAVSVCLVSTSCVTRTSSESLRKEIAALRAENFQLRKDLTESRVRLEMLREEADPAAASAAGPTAAPRQAAAPVARPRAGDAVSQVIYSEPITAVPSTAGGSERAGSAASGPGPLMDLARQRLDAKDPEGALTLFRQIVGRYPGDPLADDAQFGSGECYFTEGRYEEAIAEYRKVVNAFPFGDQVPLAFLKIGFAHLALEQRDLALDNFKNVSEAYPGTEAATVARQQIAHLKASSR